MVNGDGAASGESHDSTAGGRIDRRRFLASAASVGLAASLVPGRGAAAPGSTLDGRSWTRTWSDEFDGGAIDESTWSFRTGGGCGPDGTLGDCRWGNMESQFYTDGDNAAVEDDRLVIEARDEQVETVDGTYDYTSSRMVTAGKRSKRYGRIDVRARVPIGQGIWPAIWMLPEGDWTWPDDGEIDIMELVGHRPATVHGTVHGAGFSGADGIGGSYSLSSGTFADDFHVFSIVWDPDRIRWFVDGENYHEVTRSEVEAAGNEWPFDDSRFHVLANVAVGGEWPGYPDETTEFPKRMEIDYVRFYDEAADAGPPAVGDTETPPQDPDDDGLYEDVNGDGATNLADAGDLFQHRDSAAVSDHVDAYDFSGNEEIDLADVVDLFQENTN